MTPEAPVSGWQARPERLSGLSKATTPWIYKEEAVAPVQLPDALRTEAGAVVADAKQWEAVRRPGTLELFRQHVYGRAPQVPAGIRFELVSEDKSAMSGHATLRQVKIHVPLPRGGTYPIEAAVFIPAAARKPVPAFLLINNRKPEAADPTRAHQTEFWPAEEILVRGYATAVFSTQQVQPDKKDGLSAGLIAAMGGDSPRGDDAWATIAAWSFGASRVMDYLCTLAEIDHTRVAVIGHSRGGKTALWSGAQDPRFSLTISNDSGCGGAAISRRRFGETFELINRNFPHWFCENFKKHSEGTVPVDQHQLIALMAPRAVYVASADDDLWADPRGEFLGLAHASRVYRLYGEKGIEPHEMPPLNRPLVRGKMGYHIRSGDHGLKLVDWKNYMDFADKLWSHSR